MHKPQGKYKYFLMVLVPDLGFLLHSNTDHLEKHQQLNSIDFLGESAHCQT